jgi:ribosomal protein S18 acetylase RimI-like enzyme
VNIREAKPSDAPELQRLNEIFNGPGLSAAEEIASALRENPDELVLVAEDGEGLCGFLCGRVFRSFCYPEKNAEVTELYVDPAHRRRGVAQALMEHMEAHFCALGAHEFHLYTWKNNMAAQAFYKSAGYLPKTVIEYLKSPQEGR